MLLQSRLHLIPGYAPVLLTGPETEAPAEDAAHGAKQEAMLRFVIKMK